MPLAKDFVPVKPFPDFKWKWASLQCTEGINDPIVLLGVLTRMRNLELQNRGLTYSSDEFSAELRALATDIEGRGVNVDLARRTGSRNIMRNSSQYWKALGLIPAESTHGRIQLTDFGRMVADRQISQAEFAATIVASLRLPTRAVQSEEECALWRNSGLSFRPLHLLLTLMRELGRGNRADAYLTKFELTKIVIPLSGCRDVAVADYALKILDFRCGNLSIKNWPDCCPEANDCRIAREFLLFLFHYGYVLADKSGNEERFVYNWDIDAEISGLLARPEAESLISVAGDIRRERIASDMDHRRMERVWRRPNQARFRKLVLGDTPSCIVTNVELPEVLEAAHIVPFKYHGEDTRANGFCMRMDVHEMFDSGTLRIDPQGHVILSEKARLSYGLTIPRMIQIPDYVDLDFVRWRWDNYVGE